MKNKQIRYAPLEPVYAAIDSAMPLPQFAAVEAALYLLSQVRPDADPRKAYLIFCNYQLIGADSCGKTDYILQCARHFLGRCRSRKLWMDDLQKYRQETYDAVRAFRISETDKEWAFCRETDGYPYSYEARRKEWRQFWAEQPDEKTEPRYADTGRYYYRYPRTEKDEPKMASVQLALPPHTPDGQQRPEKDPRVPLRVSWAELLRCAERMRELVPEDPCYTVLSRNILKEAAHGAVLRCDSLELQPVTNMVGMVGAGKSTLIKVLAFWAGQSGRRMAIVADTVAETLHLWDYLSQFGIACSPLIGRRERLKYINQVFSKGDTCLSPEFSQYLTPACLIDGMDGQRGEAAAYGEEPCYSLKKDGKNYLCPYFDRCPGTKMLRDCYDASVVITTAAGFAAARTGAGRELFLQLVLREFDLAVFDECDRVQKTLDQLFMPETSFDGYIRASADDCRNYMRLGGKRGEKSPAVQHYQEMQMQSVTVLSCINRSLRRPLGSWAKTEGHFSALTLLEDLYQRGDEDSCKIPEAVYRKLYNLMDLYEEQPGQDERLWAAMEASCSGTDDQLFDWLYQAWIDGLGKNFLRPGNIKIRQVQDNRIKLILRLIYFDRFIHALGDAYAASHEASYEQNELFGFLQARFRQQQLFLPSALCGNLFGLKKTDEGDIILFRQYAFGRSLMKDLPFLRTAPDGTPAGPYALLLSGSSWAEGSYEYHINRPVNYILEAEPEKREFLKRTVFRECGFSERVSGSGEGQRAENLRKLTQNAAGDIIREYRCAAGKILLVVNSYEQAGLVQKTLEPALRREQCPAKVCRMLSDAPAPRASQEEDGGPAIRRGEVGRFAAMDADILIAPAMAIERGHNIVDETGHSALGAVFFMVRPMAVPDDIQQRGCKLNGMAEADCPRKSGENSFAYAQRLRHFAVKEWSKMSGTKSFGLSELEPKHKKDIVATLFVLILQIFGRLARVTDTEKPAPRVYFADGAFRARADRPDDFDCLNELRSYLDTLMQSPESEAVAKTLYEPFYEAYQGGIQYGSSI